MAFEEVRVIPFPGARGDLALDFLVLIKRLRLGVLCFDLDVLASFALRFFYLLNHFGL